MKADVVVVGSGPAGAACAFELTDRGFDVLVLEEGQPTAGHNDAASAMAKVYRDFGASVTRGKSPMPYLQGRALGGTSVINGAISWRLPHDVWQEWSDADPVWGSAFAWEELSAVTDDIERTLNIGPTEPSVAGANNELLAIGAQRLGLEHRPIQRNVNGCEGLGRCLQVCPNGHKMSMDRTYLSRAAALGARILTGARVTRVASNRVDFMDLTSQTKQVVSARAVVVAASAVQTPALLLRSGAKHRGIGRGFMAHPGASMAGRFAQKVDVWTGATQGHEVIGLRKQGIKFEALGFDLAIGASRFKSVGRALTRDIEDIGHWAHWGAAIRAQSQGRVRPTRIFGGSSSVSVTYELGPADMAKVRRGVAVLGEMMLAAGADFVTPGVHGFDEKVDDPERMRMFESVGPLDPRAYAMVLTHMFSTCRMGSSPDQPVALDFSVRGLPGVYVADSSVFPSNTGVNPQTSILALATLCGRRLVV